MIDFYGLTSPNVQKIFIMLEETGLPYNFKPVDVWASAQHAPEFVKLNPNRKIPVIVDTEGPGGKPYTVFESGAILMYLAEKTGKFMPADMAKKYQVIQWLMIQVSGIGPAFGNFTHFNLFAPKPGNEYSLSRYKSEMLRLYDLLNDRLQVASISAAKNTRSPTWRHSRGRGSTRRMASRSTRSRPSSAGSRNCPRGRRSRR